MPLLSHNIAEGQLSEKALYAIDTLLLPSARKNNVTMCRSKLRSRLEITDRAEELAVHTVIKPCTKK